MYAHNVNSRGGGAGSSSAHSTACQVCMYIYTCIHIYAQPIVDRVAQKLAIICKTFSTNLNCAYGICDMGFTIGTM